MSSVSHNSLFYIGFWNKVFQIFYSLSDESSSPKISLSFLEDLIRYTSKNFDNINKSRNIINDFSSMNLTDSQQSLYSPELNTKLSDEDELSSPLIVIVLDVIVQVIIIKTILL